MEFELSKPLVRNGFLLALVAAAFITGFSMPHNHSKRVTFPAITTCALLIDKSELERVSNQLDLIKISDGTIDSLGAKYPAAHDFEQQVKQLSSGIDSQIVHVCAERRYAFDSHFYLAIDTQERDCLDYGCPESDRVHYLRLAEENAIPIRDAIYDAGESARVRLHLELAAQLKESAHAIRASLGE